MSTARQDTRVKGTFGLWLFSRQPVSTIDDGLEQSTNDCMASDGSTSDLDVTPAAEREGLRTRFRRSGSKFLSLLGFRGSFPREEAVEPDNPPTPVSTDLQERAAGDSTEVESTSPDGHGLKSGPKLVTRLSTKLSKTICKSTVVHRGRFHSRHGVQVPECYVTLDNQGDYADDSSNPSTPLSGSVSPASRTRSTPPTSEEPSPDRSKIVFKNDYLERQYGRDRQGLAAIRETVYLPKSIWTVEKTTNAKVFLETHFDSLSLDISGRKARAREFSSYLRALSLPMDEQVKAREDFYRQESSYLRQCRALRSPISLCRRHDAVTHAGYEPSKIVGRGSFGVVRLVRRRRDDGILPYDISFEMDSDSSASLHAQRKCMAGRTKDVFAMKVISKTEMLRNTQEGHVRAERDILIRSEKSRWVVPLVTSFQDADNLYLVMDYMIGGDFLGLLVRKDVLPEQWAKFYLAEMVLCVEAAHRLGWIHRDLKPDNFLISASGHLRLSDFGLAFNGHWAHDKLYYTRHRQSLMQRLGIEVEGDAIDQKLAAKQATGQISSWQKIEREKEETFPPWKLENLDWLCRKRERRRYANSYVGTAQYMAPEVVKGEHYDGRCDWWCLGIILYECLYGVTPFACEDREQTRIKIANHYNYLHFPCKRYRLRLGEVSIQAMALIYSLLADKEHRLGSSRYGAVDLWMSCVRHKDIPNKVVNAPPFVYGNDSDEIKAHPFFEGVNWDRLRRVHPPFVPKVRGWGDTRYFDDNIGCLMEDDISSQGRNEYDAADYSDAEEPPEIKVPKRRARDKVLRDENVGATAMNIRKEGAFSGYSYVRPKPVALAFNYKRVRSIVPKDHLSDLYAC